MPNLITENSSISGYIESLFSKHLENVSVISYVSGKTPLDGYFSNISSSSSIESSSGVSARFILDTYNNTNTFGSSFRGRKFRGTPENPSGILKDDVLLQLVGDGYIAGSGMGNSRASMAFFAAENYISGNNKVCGGSYLTLRTTPTGAGQSIVRLRIEADGRVGISNFAPQYQLDVSGSGNFTQGIYWDGVAVNTGIDTTTFSSSSNLTQTGQTLDNKINSLSGNNYSSLKVTGSTAISAPNFSGIGTTQIFRSGNFVLISGSPSAAGAGEANTASNLSNSGLFSQKIGVDLQFKGLKAGAGISITGDANQLTVSSTASSSLSISQAEIDFGPTGVSDATFTIINSNITANSKIIGQLAWVAPTDKDIDEIEMDKLEIKCQPSGGGFLMFVESQDGSYLHDKFKINYLFGQ